MKTTLPLVIILALSLFSGCVKESDHRGITTEDSVEYDGLIRTYRLYIPSSYNITPTPLVIVLHFGGGNAVIIEQVTVMTEKAEQEGFIVVYPNGTGRAEDRFLTWNAGFCCGYAVEHSIDDVGFIGALIEHLQEELVIDASRIYVTGFCNGAALTHRIGAELSDKVAAIAPVAGSIGVTEDSVWWIPEPANPVSVIIFHGVHDGYVPYEGGVTKSGAHIASVAQSVSFWVEHNNCNSVPEKTVNESGNIIVDSHSQDNGTEVVLYTILNEGHAWPGGKKFAGGDEPTQEISATDIIWEFFENHPKTKNNSQALRSESIGPEVTDLLIISLEVPNADERIVSHLVAINSNGTPRYSVYASP